MAGIFPQPARKPDRFGSAPPTDRSRGVTSTCVWLRQEVWIRDEWMWLSDTVAPGAIPKHLANLRRNLQRLVLPQRRPERSSPWAVKVKMSNYAGKRPVVKDVAELK